MMMQYNQVRRQNRKYISSIRSTQKQDTIPRFELKSIRLFNEGILNPAARQVCFFTVAPKRVWWLTKFWFFGIASTNL